MLRQHRDQLFAEAVARYRNGEHWWPDADFERTHIAPKQEDRYEEDAWEEEIQHYLNNLHPAKTTVLKVASDALSIDAAKLGTQEQRRITAALERAGWVRQRSHGVRWWVSDPEARHAG